MESHSEIFLRHLPDYFRMELPSAGAALVESVESFLNTAAHREWREVSAARVLGTCTARIQEDLLSVGFQSDTLTEKERIEFSGMRHSLLAETHSLTGVRRLLGLYFPGASVQRGRPYPRTRLHPKTGFRLSDRKERRSVLSFLLVQEPCPQRLSEFLGNCRRLVPISIRMEALFKSSSFKTPKAWRLDGKNSGGRLSCLTSPN